MADLLAAFGRGAQRSAVLSPFNPRLASPLTLVIRKELAPVGVTLEEIELAGEYRRIVECYRSDPIGLNALSRSGVLFDLVSKAREWRAQGKPPPAPRPGFAPRKAAAPASVAADFDDNTDPNEILRRIRDRDRERAQA